MANGKFIIGETGKFQVKPGGKFDPCQECCVADIPCADINPFVGPYGCAACLCSGTSSFAVCISGETGGASVLNTGTDSLVLPSVGGLLFRYEEAGVRKVELQFTINADGFEDYEIESFLWSGGAWASHRVLTSASQIGTGACFFSLSGGGTTYKGRARADWTNATTIAVTFAGLTYSASGTPCTDGYHVSGTLNGATISGGIPNYPTTSGSCEFSDSDIGLVSNVGGSNWNVAIFAGYSLSSLGERTFAVRVTGGSGRAGPFPPYFIGEYVLGSNPCKGSYVMNNQLTTSCQVYGSTQAIAWGGTATLVLS